MLKFIFCVGPIYMLGPDKASKTCAADGVAKRLQFPAGAFGGQGHPSIRQVADGADDFKSGGHGLRGVTKTDSLHVA